jgi:hypothetical protein
MAGLGFLLSDRSGGNFQLALADGGSLTVQAVPGAGGGNTGNGILIFPNIAALEAFDVSTLSPEVLGQQAFVQTNGSWWTLVGGAFTPDGITVVNGTGTPGAQWIRENTAGYLQAALRQTAWVIDNVGGSDEASGLNGANAIKTKAEVFRRWGCTWGPQLDGITVVIEYVHSDTTPDDPGLWTPILVNGAQLVHVGAAQAASFTGTLLAVTPKAGNNPLSSTFTTTTGAVAANMLLINTTRGNSRAFAQRNLGAGNWRLTQPWAATADPTQQTAPVNTWANGDAIQGFTLLAVNLARIGGVLVDYNAGGGFGHVVAGLLIQDAEGLAGEDPCLVNTDAYTFFNDVVFQRCAQVEGTNPFARFQNTMFTGDFPLYSTAINTIYSGGAIGGAGPAPNAALAGANLQLDILLTHAGIVLQNCHFNSGIALDFAGTQELKGDSDAVSAPAAVFYGASILDQRQGVMRYSAAAAAQFTSTGGLAVNGVAAAYSRVTAAGVTTIHGGIALTAANLDAAAGAAGFGGYAEGGGAFFVQNGAQP